MAKDPTPSSDLTFAEKEDLVTNSTLAVAQKLYFGWVANELLSYDEFYVLFDILKARIP